MLTANGIKQEASYVYLHALVARLGYALERTSIDMDSVDATICSRGTVNGSKGLLKSPRVDVQLKATERKWSGGSIPFSISKKNYDDLREDHMVPKVLLVLFLPEDRQWLDWEPEKITLYAKAYWISLKGMPPSVNNSNVTVYLPQSQRLTEETVQEWMIAIANKEEIAYATY